MAAGGGGGGGGGGFGSEEQQPFFFFFFLGGADKLVSAHTFSSDCKPTSVDSELAMMPEPSGPR